MFDPLDVTDSNRQLDLGTAHTEFTKDEHKGMYQRAANEPLCSIVQAVFVVKLLLYFVLDSAADHTR